MTDPRTRTRADDARAVKLIAKLKGLVLDPYDDNQESIRADADGVCVKIGGKVLMVRGRCASSTIDGIIAGVFNYTWQYFAEAAVAAKLFSGKDLDFLRDWVREHESRDRIRVRLRRLREEAAQIGYGLVKTRTKEKRK